MPALAFLLGPGLLAVLALCGRRWVRAHPRATAYGLALIALGGTTAALSILLSGAVVEARWAWVPSLGVDLALRIDAFRALFLALICGTAASVFLFTGTAYRSDSRLPDLLATLLLFAASMIGIVVSDDLFLLFVFWEATGVLSFLLIGWYHRKDDARWKATQALLVTGLGGLALLAGFILLRLAAGTSSLAALVTLDLSQHPFTPAIILLVGLGALTKSAQFPFHFWLPNAMAGPTPVSAFLHSATMVKAGVFLLALLAPALADHPLWTPLFFSCGLLTIGAAVLRGWRETDLKAILASTTLAALGHLTILAALGTPAALQAFLVFLLAHALYKAPLFLAAGVLEEAYGSRDVTRLRGAAFVLPVPGLAIALSLLSLLGVPVLPGFLGKEYLLKSAWALSPWLSILTALSFAGVIALSLRALFPLFRRGSIAVPERRPLRDLQLTPWISTALALILTAGFPWLSRGLLTPAAAAIGAAGLKPLLLWPGWSPVLMLSLGALLVGALAARAGGSPRANPDPSPVFDTLYRTLFEALGRAATALASFLQDRRLRTHCAVVLSATGLLVAAQLAVTGLPAPAFRLDAFTIIPFMLAALIALTGISAASSRSRLELLALLGLLGLLIALLYSYFSAPDLALTQLLTETVLLVFLVAVLRKLPVKATTTADKAPAFALPIALLGGALATAVVLKAKALELTAPVSSFFTERSLSEAFGANVVNVILVDFRALDTFGEITVLSIAAIGATALLRRILPPPSYFNPTDSALLRAALPLLFASLLGFSILFFLRGHNNPGGGFIAALVAATAFGLVALVGPPSRLSRLDVALLLAGLAIATLSSLLALGAGRPFFTGLWFHTELPGSGAPLHLGTPLLFDLGVFLAVLGFAPSFLRRFLPPTRPVPSWN